MLRPGQIAEITELCPPDKTTLRKLLALGLLPGSSLKLLRRFPCYLVQMGHAQLALDRQLASAILVRTLATEDAANARFATQLVEQVLLKPSVRAHS